MNKKLKLWDATMLVMGSMIGSGIFIVSADIMRNLGSGYWLIAVWVITGIMTVASGCEWVDGRWQNDDVLQLTAASNVSAPAELINSYCFEPAIAPHIAAAQAGVEIDFNVILA